MKLPDMLQFQGERLFFFSSQPQDYQFLPRNFFTSFKLRNYAIRTFAILHYCANVNILFTEFCNFVFTFLAQYCNIIVGGIHMDQRAELLRKLMDSKNMKVSDIVKISGLPYSTVKAILERGAEKAGYINVCKICNAL